MHDGNEISTALAMYSASRYTPELMRTLSDIRESLKLKMVACNRKYIFDLADEGNFYPIFLGNKRVKRLVKPAVVKGHAVEVYAFDFDQVFNRA